MWSGNLRGVKVEAECCADAVGIAVRAHLPCLLTQHIRVSLRPQGFHALDIFFSAPYEDLFPDLFDGELDVQIAKVTS